MAKRSRPRKDRGRFGRWRAVGLVLLSLVVLAGAWATYDRQFGHTPLAALDARSCPATMDEAVFADEDELRDLLRTVTGFGLRSTASPGHQALLDWLEREFSAIEGMEVRSEPYEIARWSPAVDRGTPGGSLEASGTLSLVEAGGALRAIPIAGAVPYARPGAGAPGRLVRVEPDEALTREGVEGRIVVQDVPLRSIPLAAFWALSRYTTSDIWRDIVRFFERPYLTTGEPLARRIVEAGEAGAAGIVFVFDVPREQIAGYFNPHTGTHFALPAVYVGVDEGEILLQAATANREASIGIEASIEPATTRNLIATLPGAGSERVIINANTDGNSHVQENSLGGLLSLARAFAQIPVECRSRTIEFVLGSAHLHMSREGTGLYVSELSDEDVSSIAFAMAVEHLGARELLPEPRPDAVGRQLEFTGRGEFLGWFVGDSPRLVETSIAAVRHRDLDRTAILPGQDLPDRGRVPRHCSMGGLGTVFHERLIPTIGLISGPWSLWAPAFGEEAVDFGRMRRQLLAVGDVVRALDGVPASEILGDYGDLRRQREEGAPACDVEPIPEFAPGVTMPERP